MTLVLALRCKDGIVLASDGQVTADTAGQPTRQAARKLFDIGGRVAWGAAGSTGLQQTLRAELAAMNGRFADSSAKLRERLASTVIPIQQQGVGQYVPLPGTDPPDLVCLFCWCDDRGARILEIPRTGAEHQFHDRFAAIGTGEIFAKFAMASAARFDPSRLDLKQGKMVAYKAIADAIEVAAVFLGPPIQIYVIDERGARPVPKHEIEGSLAASVEAWHAKQIEALSPLSPAASPPARAASKRSHRERRPA